MGTIAARDGLRILELTEQVAAALLLAVTQGVALRNQQQAFSTDAMLPQLCAMLSSIEEVFPFLEEDRPLEQTLRTVVSWIQSRRWALYE